MNPRSLSLYLCIHQDPARERNQDSKDAQISQKYAKSKKITYRFEIDLKSRAEIENCKLLDDQNLITISTRSVCPAFHRVPSLEDRYSNSLMP